MGLVLLLLIPLLLSMRIFVMLASEPSPYSPEHLYCRPYRGEKVARCTEFREAVSHAGDHFFQLGYVHMLAYERDPPRIIVGIEEEKHRALIPGEFMGFQFEVEVTGKPMPMWGKR